ncbi:response regulator [bacterium]|nr:response regulator [bacterium]
MSMTPYRKIMLIDDNPIDLFLNRNLLKREGMDGHFMEHSSGASALEYLVDYAQESDRLPDLILLDIQMPVMDGFAFLEGLRDLRPRLACVPELFILSSTTNQDDIRALRADPLVRRILKKPLEVDLLKKSLGIDQF